MAIHQFCTIYENGAFSEFFKDFAEGTTLYVGSRSTQIMSDVWGTELYALYWDEDSKSVKHAHLDTYEWSRRDDGYGKASATVDATEEVWKKVELYYTDEFFREYESKALAEAKQIQKDSLVKVVAGRYSKGAEGKVVVILTKPYGMGYRANLERKFGIATSDEMIDKVVNGKVYKNYKDVVWAWARNCELTAVPSIDIESVRNHAVLSAASKVAGLRKA